MKRDWSHYFATAEALVIFGFAVLAFTFLRKEDFDSAMISGATAAVFFLHMMR